MLCWLPLKGNILSSLVFVMNISAQIDDAIKTKNTETLLKLRMDNFGLCFVAKAEDSLIAAHREILVHSRKSFSVSVYFKITKSGKNLLVFLAPNLLSCLKKASKEFSRVAK